MIVAACNVDCTVVLVTNSSSALLSDFDQKKEQGSGRISRADVAVVCCEALTNPKADRTTVSLVTEGPMPEGSSLAAQVGFNQRIPLLVLFATIFLLLFPFCQTLTTDEASSDASVECILLSRVVCHMLASSFCSRV